MFFVELILLLLVFISLTYIETEFIFHRKNEDDIIILNIKILYGLIKLNFKIPYIDIILNKNMKLGVRLKGESKLFKQSEALNFEELKRIYKKLMHIRGLYGKVFKYILSKIYLKYISWYTKIGFEDAALTAVCTGILWTVKFNLINMISVNKPPEEIKINVNPEYKNAIFEIELHCIIKIKIANIIIAGLKAGYIFLKYAILKKGGESSERSSYSRVNENYNG